METYRYYCDKCGKEIHGGKREPSEMCEHGEHGIEASTEYLTINVTSRDLCEACGNKELTIIFKDKKVLQGLIKLNSDHRVPLA